MRADRVWEMCIRDRVYGLRDLLENTPERFEEVMTRIKEMGYDGVELAGTYGLEPGYILSLIHI